MTIRLRYQWLLLAAVVLGFYYPAIFGGYSLADDLNRLNSLINLETFDFSQLFFRSGGYYYRPISASTFYFDQMLWGSEALIMHVENLLLHLLNASLVFMIAMRLCRQSTKLLSYLPLLTALLFALHPVNAEAVCWISGRYDLLATTFALTSTWLLLWALSCYSLWRILPALLVALLGCLAKETALFFFGGAVLILYVHFRQKSVSLIQTLPSFLPGFALWCGGALTYLAFRQQALSGRDTGVGVVIKSVAATEGVVNWADQLRIAVKVSGFYFKKIFFPYPLNFSIVEISHVYLGVGVLLIIVCVWLVWRADLSAAFFLGSVLTCSAALLVVFGKMAWTPVAERYLYMPTAFFALGWSAWASACCHQKHLQIFKVVMLCFVIAFGGMTIQRAQLWSDPVALAEDTVEKSPKFLPARKDLANYYLAMGEEEKGRKLLASVMSDSESSGYVIGDISMASQLMKEGKLEEAHHILLMALENPGKQTLKLIESVLKINTKRLGEAPDRQAKLDIHLENVMLFEKLKEFRNDPFLDYRLAKEYMSLGEAKRAQEMFESAYLKAPPTAFYRDPARKLAEKMAASQND